MTPLAARMVVGADARRFLPLSALFGALLLLGADVIAQSVTFQPPFAASAQRAGLPVGAVIACIGAPLLLIQLRRARTW